MKCSIIKSSATKRDGEIEVRERETERGIRETTEEEKERVR